MLSIKDKSIVKVSKKTWGTEVIINRYKPDSIEKERFNHLSDALSFLPSGFVYKEETGMGATTLEINAARNSIIIEPIKITASSKAYKHACLYVGSETRFHNKKSPSVNDIITYAKDPQIQYKKIIVVADSFRKVLVALNEDDDIDIHSYFFVIDEIDSFQLDSSYRKSMEDCIDYYKMIKPLNRAMLSATRINFSDPDLKKEPITYIKYDQPSSRNINVITTNFSEIDGVIFDTILKHLANNPNEKIFIAYNSVSGCYNLAEHLVSTQNIKKDDIKILCSAASKNKVNEYYHELNSDELPGQINLFTSAYFTGFDLNESYHLISVSGSRIRVLSLSDRRFKQIAGRCRTGLLSETIIHDVLPNEKIIDHTEEDYIDAAKDQIASLNCMVKHYYRNPILETIIGEVNEKILETLDLKEHRYVRKNVKGEYEISYLNIDAKLEANRVIKTLYSKLDALTEKLKKDGNLVTSIIRNSSTKVVDQKVSKTNRDNEVIDIIDKLKKFKYYTQIDDLQLDEKLTPIQQRIANDYKKLIGFLDPITTLEIIKSNIIGKRDLRTYKKAILSALIQTLHKDDLIKSRINHYFPVNKKFEVSEVISRIDLFLGETNNFISVNTDKSKLTLLNILCETYRKRDKSKKDYYVIKGHNPFKYNRLRTKESMKEHDIFTTLKSYF